MDEPTILSAWVHYGFPTVTVEPYRMAYQDGSAEVDTFVRNGGIIEASGFKIRKDGQPANRRVTLHLPIPTNVITALRNLEAPS